jgi:hypothetical protein
MRRREFLAAAGVIAVEAGMRPVVPTLARAVGGRSRPVDHSLSGRHRLDSLHVPAGHVLTFDPHVDTIIEVAGNVIVEGTLRMRPSGPHVRHTLRFVGVDESAFVGGGMDPLVSDVGLWVINHGRLDIVGTPKRAWNRTGTSATWRKGDEIRVAPTAHGDFGGSGFRRFAPGARVPKVAGLPPAEVLNLTRNVRIEGTPRGRSHIFIRSSAPQRIAYAQMRYMGPRQPSPDPELPTQGVKGRYGLHFHMCGGGSRGSIVRGVVIRDTGSHAFVAHLSHGVTFSSCISYDTIDEPYWWDPNTVAYPGTPDNYSDGIVYRDCVAALVRFDPNFRGYLLTGFWLGASTIARSNRCIGCVAVGVHGAGSASGFQWPEDSEGVWIMEDCVGHNNAVNGIFTWQNTSKKHDITGFAAYRNGNAGIEHGAYVNPYRYSDALLVENRWAGVIVHSMSPNPPQPRHQTFDRVTIEGRGVTRYGFLVGESPTPDGTYTLVHRPRITGVTKHFQLMPDDTLSLDQLIHVT